MGLRQMKQNAKLRAYTASLGAHCRSGFSLVTGVLRIKRPKEKIEGQSAPGFYHFAFNRLGKHLEGAYHFFRGLEQPLDRSGLRVGLKAYVSGIFLCSLISIIVSTATVSILFLVWPFSAFFARTLSHWVPHLGFLVPLSSGALTFLVMYAYPHLKASSRGERMDQLLSHTASYFTVLACAGVSPERILRSAAAQDSKLILSDEIKRIVGKIDLLGHDVISAIDSESERSPSHSYSNLLRGFATTIRTGGDLKKFLLNSTRQLMKKQNLMLRQFIDNLVMLAEVYVIMLIAFPLFLVIMLSIMAMVGGTIGGLGAFQFMYLIAFILIPVCGAFFLILVDGLQPKG